MPFNLLILPLLGGFLLATHWRRTRYRVLRMDGYRLLIYSSIAGVCLLGLADFIHAILHILSPDVHRSLGVLCHDVAPFPYSGRPILSFLLALPLIWTLNRLASRSDHEEMARVIVAKNDPFEMLLREAAGQGKMVAFTMKNGKVYVGIIIDTNNPTVETQYIKIFPQASGYRDEEKNYVFTVDYSGVYKKLRADLRRIKTTPSVVIDGGADEQDKYLARKLNAIIATVQPDMRGEATAWYSKLWSFVIRASSAQRSFGERVASRIETDLLEDFQLVLPVAEIQSLHIFVPAIYYKNFLPQGIESADASTGTAVGEYARTI